jgi:hypothetical protein
MTDPYISGGAKIGLESALAYYRENGTPWCMIFQGKPGAKYANPFWSNIKGKFEDVDECIERIRQKFAGTGSDRSTRYHLVFWEDKPKLQNGIPIEPATETIIFILATEAQISGNVQYYMQRDNRENEIISRLAAIEEKMNGEDEDEEPQPSTQEQIISGIMANPALMTGLQAIIMRIVDNFVPAKQSPVKLARVAETGAPDNIDLAKLDQALTILKNADPQLEDDLMLLANLAQNDPHQFNFLLKMLRK